jgi:hypothetical protein
LKMHKQFEKPARATLMSRQSAYARRHPSCHVSSRPSAGVRRLWKRRCGPARHHGPSARSRPRAPRPGTSRGRATTPAGHAPRCACVHAVGQLAPLCLEAPTTSSATSAMLWHCQTRSRKPSSPFSPPTARLCCPRRGPTPSARVHATPTLP